MAVQREIWVNYISENLFKDNAILEHCFKEDQFVVGGKFVHIPQAGSRPATKKNRTKLPATVHTRKDADILYPLDEFTTDPTLIPNADKVELSYDKIDSVLGEHMKTLKELVTDWLIYLWAAEAANKIIRTTGSAAAATAPGATGNRLAFVKEDLKKARLYLNKQDIPKEGRFAALPSDLLDQLMDDEALLRRDTALELNLEKGVITKLYGFNILERSSIVNYTNAALPVRLDPEDEVPEAANEAAICYHKDTVVRALGDVNFFEDINNPLYYGDLYSALIRMGGRKRRENAEGIVSIVQAHETP